MRKPKRADILFWLCAVLTAVVVNTCIQIEHQNHRAADYLEVRRNLDPGSTWEPAPTTDKEEHRARFIEQVRRVRRMSGDELQAPPTAEELRAFEAHWQLGLSMNRLHFWMSTFGLLQYVLAPVVVLWSWYLAVTSRKYRIPSVAFALAALACIVMMLYRQYFQSLGW